MDADKRKEGSIVEKKAGFVHRNYHWIVVAVVMLMLLFYGGLLNNMGNLHLIPITEYLGITRAQFSLAMNARMLMATASTFASGFLIARFGSRITAPLGLLVAAAALFVLANLTNYWMLLAGCVLYGTAYGLCATSGAVVIVRLWFHRHQGTVLGLVTASTGLGSSLIAVIQTAAMEATGTFRSSFYFGAIALVVVAVLMVAFIRSKPEDMGLAPYGEGENAPKKKKTDGSFQGPEMGRLCKMPVFYLMILCTVTAVACVYLTYCVIRTYLQDCGYSPAQATSLYSTMMLLLAGSKFLVGFASDKIGGRRVNLLCVFLAAVGLTLLLVMKNYIVAMVAVVVFAGALPIITIMTPILTSSVLGFRAQAQYTGIFVGTVKLTQLVSNYVTNWIFDTCGSYKNSLILSIGLAAVTFGLYLLLYRMSDKMKVKEERGEQVGQNT